MPKYELLMPVIGGTLKTVYEAADENFAAQACWATLTSKTEGVISNTLPQFFFTIYEASAPLSVDTKLYHFKVTEKIPDGKNVTDYSIGNITDFINEKVPRDDMKKVIATLMTIRDAINNNAHKMTGGKYGYSKSSTAHRGGRSHKKHRRSSSSSSDDDILTLYNPYINTNTILVDEFGSRLYYWGYAPTLYQAPMVYSPTFMPSISVYPPYVQLLMVV